MGKKRCLIWDQGLIHFNMRKHPFYFFSVLIFALFLNVTLVSAQESALIPQQLRNEYLNNPTGQDEPHPRLSWTLRATDDKAYGQRQTAYRILVASSDRILRNHNGDIWDSGWVPSASMQQIIYGGNALVSDRSYYWKVAVKDEKGAISAWSEPAFWSTGLLQKQEWKASWIGTDELFDPKQADCNLADPWFRKTIKLTKKPGKAILFVASVGYHELYVNGRKIGEDVLSGAVTDHTKRARYLAYNIAPALQKGTNVVALWLGTSWSIHGPYVSDHRPNTPIVIAQADIYTQTHPRAADKPIAFIRTDGTWKTHPSPNKLLGIWDSNRMGGELYDATKEVGDWNSAITVGNAWKSATVYDPKLILSAQQVATNKLLTEIKPVAIEARPDGSYRVDMGVNFAGWTEVKLTGKPGDKIEFLYSERPQNEMTFGLHSAYILGSTGKGTFRNRFNYSSGRWVTIKGLSYKPSLADIRGWQVRTAYQATTTFSSSDSLQNWIYSTVKWTFENLSLGGYVVDCPQRERLGYGGDAHSTCETGMYNYDLGAFYTKWMEDWRDVQGTESIVGNMYNQAFARKGIQSGRIFNNGILPHTAPTYMGGGGPAWGGIVVSLPWFFYEQEGDKRLLEKNFDLIKGWLSFLDLNTKDNLLQRFGGPWDFLGDWLWPHAGAEGMNNNKPQTLCLNNAYRVYNLRTAVRIARVIGRTSEADEWDKKASIYSQAIHQRFYNSSDHSYADSSMANLAAALLAEIPPPELRSTVFKRLEDEILIKCHGHINVGITAGALLFKLLRNEGRDDLLYSMTSQTDYPGWGYMKANGATTIWEMWEKDLPGHSLLHSSYLYPGSWYVEGVAGIRRDPSAPGFQRFIVRPPLLNEEQLQWAKASYDSPAGLIRSAWKREHGKLHMNIQVPPNTIGVLQLRETDHIPLITENVHIRNLGMKNGFTEYELEPGAYSF
ncbi:alpha-L-rhamnosidase [bacterium A37T11]|nr:alpha-L-rhamnosidase [bacterium A37T11]